MPINNSLTAPFLPQSSNGIIDESELSQPVLVVIVNRYEYAHIGDYIIVHLNDYISSKPFYIIEENIHLPNYEIIIPFSVIPFGSYDVFYTVTDWTGNPVSSATNHVTIKKSDYPQPFLEATLIITGYQSIGDEYEILTIQVHDKQTSEQIKNTAVSYEIDQAINISDVSEIGSNPDTIQSMTTDEYGQFKINLKGEVGGNCIIRVTANNRVGSIKYTMGQQ
ncbi:hypothetical protein [Xenorhabdus budapestensis]|uniref:Big-1 domain-containing protein n=1 Tax=Xenorhabdus budapestensis TaxID=290110 RepID=A0A2D0IT78_XENBU|nr:hypothetical protein [Xenorhabdus budapestensis]PHM25060.1 hypothetical protein Xbud_03133 [Xenorhabdus budapestensis]